MSIHIQTSDRIVRDTFLIYKHSVQEDQGENRSFFLKNTVKYFQGTVCY